MASVVNGSSASSSSSSHVGSAPTTTTVITSSNSSSSSATATAASASNSSELKSSSRSRRSKKRGTSGSAGSNSGSPTPVAATLSATAPAFTPSSVTKSLSSAALEHKRKQPAAAATARKPPASASRSQSNGKARGSSSSTNAARAQDSTDADGADDSDSADLCLLCADPIKYYAVGECNHTGMCSKCFMRMRMILHDKACPMCKTVLERVIVSRELRTYDSFAFWGDALGPDALVDEPSEMIFFECRAHYDAMRALRAFKCRVKKCKDVKQSLGALKEHLRRDHGAEFCELCLQHQHFFVQEQHVFTKATLKAHNVGRNRSTGPKHSGKDFHPMCQFCRKRFYGDAELFEHLERDHFKCHICKIEHEYFRNYASLETHFRREHHLCEEPSCLSNRYVVFPNDIEYHAHMSSIHGMQNRLLFNFQVARGGENPIGGRAEPAYADDAPEFWNYDAVDDAPTPRTQLESAFPALPTPSAPAPAPVIPPEVARPLSLRSAPAAPAPVAAGPPRGQVVRNQRLAQALGLARPAHANGTTAAFEEEMKTPNYPEALVEWGKHNGGYLTVVERRLERIVNDPKTHSVSLRFMPADERKLMHELASFYGVPSESFGEDPFRRISFFKKDGARVPLATLSSFIRGRDQQKSAASRLSFLPLRRPGAPNGAGTATGAAAAQAPAPPPRPVVRGWEKIEPKRAPVVRDAWSDDEDDDNDNGATVNAQANGHDDKSSSSDGDNDVSARSAADATTGLETEFVLTYIEDEA